ncbi:MAG: flagellar biosynthetic protein FliQ [Planctomycetota bacterium]|nr:MAG: flagellar biosynthetic protein FliQ [Planctomycetota bacterium]
MTEPFFYLIYQGIWTLFLSLGPILCLSWLIGILFSFLGKYFQIQDTAFIQSPKTMGLVCSLWILLPWEIGIWKSFVQLCLSSFFVEPSLWNI